MPLCGSSQVHRLFINPFNPSRMRLWCSHHSLPGIAFTGKVAGRALCTPPRCKRIGLYRKQLSNRKIHASSADAALGLDEEVAAAGAPRCWLVPSEGGGYDEVCVTEGTTFIGAAESDYYFSDTKGMPSSACQWCMHHVVLCMLWGLKGRTQRCSVEAAPPADHGGQHTARKGCARHQW